MTFSSKRSLFQLLAIYTRRSKCNEVVVRERGYHQPDTLRLYRTFLNRLGRRPHRKLVPPGPVDHPQGPRHGEEDGREDILHLNDDFTIRGHDLLLQVVAADFADARLHDGSFEEAFGVGKGGTDGVQKLMLQRSDSL